MEGGGRRTARIVRIVAKTLRGAVLGAIVLLALLLGGVRLLGLTPYAVLSGSMEPTYPVGSVIYVAETEPEELRVKDPLTYRIEGGTVVTHRIEEILNEGTPLLSFVTKGDANQTADSPVPASAVIGRPLFCLPYLGYVSEFIRHPVSLLSVIVVGAAVTALSFAAESLLKSPSSEEKQGAEKP